MPTLAELAAKVIAGRLSGGLPVTAIVFVVANGVTVVWQPDGEVKTLGRKP